MKKAEILYVKPKTEESKEIFDILMYKLHSCKVMGRNDGNIFLKSITNNYDFYVKEKNDPNWEFIK